MYVYCIALILQYQTGCQCLLQESQTNKYYCTHKRLQYIITVKIYKNDLHVTSVIAFEQSDTCTHP